MGKHLQSLIIAIISMLVAFLANRKEIPELISDRINKVISIIYVILLIIYTNTDPVFYINFSFLGFEIGWIIKGLLIYSHRSKK